MELALFPLKTVLLPGNSLSLKIFEPRYTDMIAECMREQKPFGVVMIHRGQDTNSEVEIHTTGTTAMVTDWQNRDDGLLGITIEGQQCFTVQSTHTLGNGLLIGEIELLPEEQKIEIPDQFYYMQELLAHIANRKHGETPPDDFCQIVYQLIYLLPLENTLKQQLLEVPQCMDRAVVLHAELIRLGVIQYVKPESSD